MAVSWFLAWISNMGCQPIRLFGFIPVKKRAKTNTSVFETKTVFFSVLRVWPEILDGRAFFGPMTESESPECFLDPANIFGLYN